MAASFSKLSLTPLMDEDGVPIVGAFIRFYDAGTTTPRITYRDGLLSLAYDPNNIRTNGAGRIPPIWIDGNPYRVVITKSGGALIEDIDNLPVENAGGGPAPAPDTAIETADIVWAYRTGARVGFVIPNGLTVGSATSGATGRANGDSQALFKRLWETNASLAVSGGRGTNAASDWAANKTIALPNLCGTALFSADGAGIPATGRLAGVTFTSGNAMSVGSFAGSATTTLTIGQLPTFTVSGTTGAAGGHVHTGTTDSAGAHAHTGSVTVSYPAHVYTRWDPAITGFFQLGNSQFGAQNGGFGDHATAPPGPQAFSLAIDATGHHVHPFTTAAAGTHAHDFTSNPIGLGQAIENVPPLILLTPYMKL